MQKAQKQHTHKAILPLVKVTWIFEVTLRKTIQLLASVELFKQLVITANSSPQSNLPHKLLKYSGYTCRNPYNETAAVCIIWENTW